MKKTFLIICLILVIIAASPSPAQADRTIVRLETSSGDITLELYDDEAPVTVDNFLSYVNSGFYDGLIFHRVIDDFMIQTGSFDADIYPYILDDPNFEDPNWTQNPLFYHEPNEPIPDETDNGLQNDHATIAMANRGPDTGTSQFFINQKTDGNHHLDGDHTVFGAVIDGMDVVDEIAAINTLTIGEGSSYPMEDVPVEDDAVLINRAVEVMRFDENSADLSDTAFLAAEEDVRRVYIGQGAKAGVNYLHQFRRVEFLGIDCLHWQQQVLTGNDDNIDEFSLYLAGDISDTLWVLKYYLNGSIQFEAESLLDAIPLADFDDENMYFRLITGNYNPDDLEDPNNVIITGTGEDIETTRIESVTASLDNWPDFADELVLVKWSKGPAEQDIDRSYYHESVGLALNLLDDGGDPQGDGWQLTEPQELENVEIVIRAGKNRDGASDTFIVWGKLEVQEEYFAGGDLFLRVGPYQTVIETNDNKFRWLDKRQTFIYKGVPDDDGVAKITLKIDLGKGTFRIAGNNVDLSGLDEPILVDINVGEYFGGGTAQIRGGNKVPILLQRGHKDELRKKRFRFIDDSNNPRDYHYSLTVQGEISTREYPLNLTEHKVTVSWGANSFGISRYELIDTVGKGQMYVYRNRGGNLKEARFNWKNCTFKVVLRRSSLAKPAADLGIKIEDADDNVVFDEEVSVQ